ncbi:efflux RND transporter periplasmic adaptor subunit [Leptothoe sp. PORK10 BA2]|uniref:efflux RND transporter periplasmic adaptor subunit n=1 Tax=Leptothoe sp. PORK10 BA2 TaxID=3110254 RepID=UPI002B21D920|nr:efflux RND transporter periplasmic adaptor subunit [Leptothoe sp. PORK10 BA2]MEA5463597.1 efflux RND transporter periplasmic adaptor subunit [Leptothoe sp. PORK10 BA2]
MTFTLKCGDKTSVIGIGLTLLLLMPAVKVLAHAGHGNEFNHSQSAQTKGAIAVDDTTADRIGLKVEPVTRQSLAFGVQATGQIETPPSRSVEVTNPVGGTVVRLLVEPGDRIEVGQALAVITSGELAELRVTALENAAERQGDVQQAEANARLAQQSYERQQKIALTAINQTRTELRVAQEQYERDRNLTEKGALPRRELLESEANLALVQQAVTEAESQLEVLAAQTEVERTQTALKVAQSRAQLSTRTYQTRLEQLGAEANPDGTITIKAPISGTITNRAVTLGQSAEDAGETLMTIVDDRTVLATANIYEKDLNQVSQGQRVRVTTSSLPDQLFEGQITNIGSLVEGENRVVLVRAELDNTDGTLKPGMFAELEVLTDRTPEPVVAIPQSAIVEANGQPIVFVQNGNSFQPVEVTLGRQAGDLVEVESGLFEGDRIVTQRANQLYAQSLRGGSAEPEEAETTEVTETSGAGGTLPWWVLLSGSGALAIGTFAAGAFWSNRRNRKQLTSAMTALERLEDPHNMYHATPDNQPALLHPADPHHRDGEIPAPPHQHH